MQCERATLRDNTTRCLSCFFVTTVCGVITVSTTTHVFSFSFDTVRGPGKGKEGCWMQAPPGGGCPISPNVPLLVPAARKRRPRLGAFHFPYPSPRRQWHRCSLRVPGKRRAMAVTSFSRFLRAHTCAPPSADAGRTAPTATRGREEGVDAQPLPRSVSHLARAWAMRAAVRFLSLCQGD